MTKLIDFKKNINDNDLNEIKNIILNNGIIVFPTETVYGIGANIYSEEAIEKIFKAKGRPNDNPLIVHISNMDMLDGLVSKVDDISLKLMDNFWPGALTIILPKTNKVSNSITASLDTVGVRMPSSAIALKIIEACNEPLAAPSANISGKPSGTNIEDIYNELNNKVDAIVDGGNTDIGLESTVVKVIGDTVHILRPGKVTKEDIASIGLKVFDNNINAKIPEDEKVMAPGMKYRHYAPTAEAILVFSEDNEKMIGKIKDIINQNKNKKIIVIASTENKEKYNTRYLIMGSKNDMEEISQNIFSLLRKADQEEPDLIIIEGVKSSNIGTAIMNRLLKACSHNYIEI